MPFQPLKPVITWIVVLLLLVNIPHSFADGFVTELPKTEGLFWAGFDVDTDRDGKGYSSTYPNYASLKFDGTATSATAVSNGVTLTVTNPATDNIRNRGSLTTSGNYTDLSQDFTFTKSAAGQTADKYVQLSLTGLNANQTYFMRVYSHDTGTNANNGSLIYSRSADSAAIYNSSQPTFLTGIYNHSTVPQSGYTDLYYTSDASGAMNLVLSPNDASSPLALFNGLELVETPATLPVIRVDYNSGSSANMPGYQSLKFDATTLEKSVYADPNTSVTTTLLEAGLHRNRTSGGLVNALVNDFVFTKNATDTLSTTLTGLTVGKTYELKVYSVDVETNGGTASTWSILSNGAEKVVRQSQISMTTSGAADTKNYFSTWFTADSDTITLKGTPDAGNFVFLNGLELNEVWSAADGLTRFDVTSDHRDGSDSRIVAPRSTEVFVKNDDTVTSVSAVSPSGIAMTVTAGENGVLRSRTRNIVNTNAEMTMMNDHLFAKNNTDPLKIQLDGLAHDTLYRMTVYTHDPGFNQSAGTWTLSGAGSEPLFSQYLASNNGQPATWQFSKYLATGENASYLLTGTCARTGGHSFLMFNGLQLETIDAAHADYTWAAPGNSSNWTGDFWTKPDGTTGTPAAGDLCYVANKWLRVPSANATFAPTLLLGAGGELLMGYSATVNDLILDGGAIHQGSNATPAVLSGNLYIARDSFVDLDDTTHDRVVQINSEISGPGGLTVNGTTANVRTLRLNHANPYYTGTYTLSNAVLDAQTAGALDGASLVLNGISTAVLTGNQELETLRMLDAPGSVKASGDLTVDSVFKNVDNTLAVDGTLALESLTLFLPDGFNVSQPFSTGISAADADWNAILTHAVWGDGTTGLNLYWNGKTLFAAAGADVPEPTAWLLLLLGLPIFVLSTKKKGTRP